MGFALSLTTGMAGSRFDSLIANSPIGSAKTAQPADAGNQPVEFRGVLEENGQLLFSVFDTATKRSRWIPLNDSNGEVVVKSYNAETNTIALEQNGRALSLILKSGPRIVQNIPPPPMSSNMQAGVNGLPGQIMPNGVGKGPEQQRLQQIAEEIRRRRALRQQPPQMPASNAPGGPAFTPGSGTGPMPMPNTNSGSNTGPMPIQNGAPGSMPNFTPKQ